MEFVNKVVTREPVCVDSVKHTDWEADQFGTKKIVARELGVTIYTNFNSTFVPWHNVMYTNGPTDSRFNDMRDNDPWSK